MADTDNSQLKHLAHASKPFLPQLSGQVYIGLRIYHGVDSRPRKSLPHHVTRGICRAD